MLQNEQMGVAMCSMVKKLSRQQGGLSQTPLEHLNLTGMIVFQRDDHLLGYVALSNDLSRTLSQFSSLIFILTVILYAKLIEICLFCLPSQAFTCRVHKGICKIASSLKGRKTGRTNSYRQVAEVSSMSFNTSCSGC